MGGLYPWHNSSKNGRTGTWGDDVSTETVDDVATALWGSNWREPTLVDVLRLCNCLDELDEDGFSQKIEDEGNHYTVWTWCDGSTEQYISGCTLAGWKVSGKDDFAGNSIFLPATGYYNAEEIVNVTDREGNYWTSGYYTEDGSKYVHALEFCSYNPDDNTYGYETGYEPHNGLAVRPVHK